MCPTESTLSWTRGTGLMDQSNMVTQEIETLGLRTFSAKEMAFNILGLMHPTVPILTSRSGARFSAAS